MRAIEEHVDQSISRLRDELGGRLAHIERRLDHMEARFTAFEFQLAGIGKSLIPENTSTVKCRLPKPPSNAP